MNLIAEQQARFNRASERHWDCALEHRNRVTQLVIDRASERGSLCVLGAGNCNDLDLTRLAGHFDSITLVDLDRDGVESAVDRQLQEGTAARAKVNVVAPLDVTGAASQLASMGGDVCVDTTLETIGSFDLCDAIGKHDTVVSVCLLSQLIWSLRETIGDLHPRYLELVIAVRLQHLKSLVDCVCKGGHGVLIADFVSSETVPDLESKAHSSMSQLVASLLESQNFFTGVNPGILYHSWNEHFGFAITDVTHDGFWLWDFGIRQYLVSAYSFEKR